MGGPENQTVTIDNDTPGISAITYNYATVSGVQTAAKQADGSFSIDYTTANTTLIDAARYNSTDLAVDSVALSSLTLHVTSNSEDLGNTNNIRTELFDQYSGKRRTNNLLDVQIDDTIPTAVPYISFLGGAWAAVGAAVIDGNHAIRIVSNDKI